MSLKGHVAWVTGGGRGIGKACAIELAKEGSAVSVTSRTEEEVHAAAGECAKHGGEVFSTRCDVTDVEQVAKAYRAIVKALGPPDLLVNNAGLGRSAPFMKTTQDFLDLHWRTNLVGTFNATQAVLPAMLEKGRGRVVNIASVAGKVGAPYIAAYAASKHAVLGLTRSLAAEYAAKNITFNAVCPGYVDTPMTTENVRNIADKTGMTMEQALDKVKRMSPQNRLTSPAEVAAVVLFLCSDAASNINGQAITVDGGAVQW